MMMMLLLFIATVAVSCQDVVLEAGGVSYVQQTLRVDPHPAALAVADVDGDGRQDLLVASEATGRLTLFRGDGTGGLRREGTVAAGDHPVDLALADFDGDGDLDVVAANHETRYLTLLLGTGDGAFRPAPSGTLALAVQPHPHAVLARDMDGDGRVDLLVDDRQGRGLRLLRGRGDGTFTTPGLLIPTGGDPYRGMAAGDLNGDGQPDLVTPNPRAVGVVLQSDPPGGFMAPASIPAPAPFAVALLDLNGDGHLDLLAASDEGSGRLDAFVGDGQGGFGPLAGAPWRMGSGAKKMVTGDFNGDGWTDVAVSAYHSPDVLLLYGHPTDLRTATVPGGQHPWALAAGDLNGDGRDDLVVADDATARVRLYLSRTP